MAAARTNHSLGAVYNKLVRLEFESEWVFAVHRQFGFIFNLEHASVADAAGLSRLHIERKVCSHRFNGPFSRSRPTDRHRMCTKDTQLSKFLFLPQGA
jgi:hypothetical protein